MDVEKLASSPGYSIRIVVLRGRVPDDSIDVAPPSTNASEPVHEDWRVCAVISGSTEDVRIRREHGRDGTGGAC